MALELTFESPPPPSSLSLPSSPLSSLGSLSPPPPEFYPSPSSSQEGFRSTSPSRRTDPVVEIPVRDDGPSPAKKRRTVGPKSRITEYYNLHKPTTSVADNGAPLERLVHALKRKKKIVVIAGAGISVAAGVPDFRSSHGLFNTLRSRHNVKGSGKHLFDASVYKTDASTSSFHDMVRSLSDLVSSAEPTAFHHLLARLAKEGRLLRLYTQNVDGIDTSLPPLTTRVPLGTQKPWPQTIQLHGGLGKMVCQKCHDLSDFDSSLFDGPDPPPCPECEQMDSVRTTIAGKRSHGIGRLRPRMVLYNEHNPDDEAIGAVTKADLRSRPDAVIVVGTSLKIPGVRRIVKEMCGVTRGRRDGVTAWINNTSEPPGREFEDCWDIVIRGDSDQVAHHVNLRRWDDDSEEGMDVTDDSWDYVTKSAGEPQVVIKTPTKKSAASNAFGVLTPADSPRMGLSPWIQPTKDPGTPSKMKAAKQGKPKEPKDAMKSKSRTSKKPPRAKPEQKGGIKEAFKVKKKSAPPLEEKSLPAPHGLKIYGTAPHNDSPLMTVMKAESPAEDLPTTPSLTAEADTETSSRDQESETQDSIPGNGALLDSPSSNLPPDLKILLN